MVWRHHLYEVAQVRRHKDLNERFARSATQDGGQLRLLQYDDFLYVTDNPYVQRGVSWGGVVWAFTTGEGGNWHPPPC